MATPRAHWITALTELCAALMLIAGTGMVVSGGEFDETEVRLYGVASVVGGLALLGAIWMVRTSPSRATQADLLVNLGAVILAVVFWWLFIPILISFVILEFAVRRDGLERELRPS